MEVATGRSLQSGQEIVCVSAAAGCQRVIQSDTPAKPHPPRGRRARSEFTRQRWLLQLFRLRFWNSEPHYFLRPRETPSKSEAGRRSLQVPGWERQAGDTPRPLNSPPREPGAGRRAGGRRGRVTRDRSPGGAGTRVHSRCSLRRRQTTGLLHSGLFPPESAPDSREPVTARTWKTSAFVISCRPVGFRMRRGARSFPPPLRPLSVFERERRSDGPVAAPGRVSGAGLPSPPLRRVTAAPRPRPPPGPCAPPFASPRLQARCTEPGAPAGGRGRSGPVGAGQGRPGLLVATGLASHVEVHVDVAVVCQNPAGSSRDRSLPGSSFLFPAPLRRSPGVTLGVGGGRMYIVPRIEIKLGNKRFSFFIMRA